MHELTQTDLRLARAELESVLSSQEFRRAPNLSRILRYVCEKYFDGDIDAIREYNIATEALGRPEHFNPGEDSIVRVEASRLRKRLYRYYRMDGAAHGVQIHLPQTGYVPTVVTGNQRVGAICEPGPEHRPDVLAVSAPTPPSAASFGYRQAKSRARRVSRGLPRQLPRYRTLVTGALLSVAVFVVFLIAAGSLSKQTAAPVAPVPKIGDLKPGPAATQAIRISAGMTGPRASLGQEWLGDRYFSGGEPVEMPAVRILRTTNGNLYQTARRGHFRYEIPLEPGIYELHIHFCEIQEGVGTTDLDGTGRRRFTVLLNGAPLLIDFDIVVDAAGPGIADERVFTDISPAPDGFLHLEFKPSSREALLAGIEILPGIPGKMRPVRILAGGAARYDSLGRLWTADRYYLGGDITTRCGVASGTEEPGLYSTTRWGNYNYAIPAADGRYTVTLVFAEGHFREGQLGERLFDVYCNGRMLLESFDILKEAGGPGIIVKKTFRGLTPNHQGKLLLSFVPEKDYAALRAIEVIAE